MEILIYIIELIARLNRVKPVLNKDITLTLPFTLALLIAFKYNPLLYSIEPKR